MGSYEYLKPGLSFKMSVESNGPLVQQQIFHEYLCTYLASSQAKVRRYLNEPSMVLRFTVIC